MLVVAGAVLGLCMWPTRPWIGISVFAVFGLVWCGAAIWAATLNWVLPVVPVLSTFGFVALGMLGLETTAMRRDRTRVLDVLGRYISPPILRRLVHTSTAKAAQTERRELSVFFSDIRGFTSWTERAEPDEVAIRLNEYFAAMTPIVEKHRGTLDKFIGDSIMVFMGAPEPQPDHAIRTVRMAIEMQEKMRDLNRTWQTQGLEPLEIGIGIHSGFVTVGSFGSPSFLDYTVIGRGVNLASRIESAAEGGTILISSRTNSLVRNEVSTKLHSKLKLKGIPESQEVFEVLNLPSS
jgi:class 3 adenylate cyclase